LLFSFVAQPVCHFMPDHLFHFASQISFGTSQNGATKNKYQFGSIVHLVERPFRPECAAVQSQQLGSAAPFLFLRYALQHFRRRLIDHLNPGEIWQVPDLRRQCAVCPLDNLLKAFGICGIGHQANFTTWTRPLDVVALRGKKCAGEAPAHRVAILERSRGQ